MRKSRFEQQFYFKVEFGLGWGDTKILKVAGGRVEEGSRCTGVTVEDRVAKAGDFSRIEMFQRGAYRVPHWL